MRAIHALVALVVLVAGLVGCGGDDEDSGFVQGALSGRIDVDGSSTVAPFVTRAAERFLDGNPGVAIIVSVLPSRTHGGFERFCAGETDLSSASRPIEAEEKRACRREAIEYVELQVANDALTVVVNPENDWADCLTLNELKKIWEPGSDVDNWREVRAGFPDKELELFGPGSDSGTFDYFTEAVVGREGGSRTDFAATDDDNATVDQVARTEGGLGYFGLTYYSENADELKALQVDGGAGCVAPSVEASQNGDYEPLSRPLFIYVSRPSLQMPAVRAFVEYVVANAQTIAKEALLVPLTDQQQEREQAEFDRVAEEIGPRD